MTSRNPRFIISPTALGLSTLLIYLAAILAGLAKAELWDQVIHLWDHGWTIANWHVPVSDEDVDSLRAESVRHDAHRLRYFLAYPLFWVGEHYMLDPDSLFTALVPALAAVTVWASAEVVVRRSGQPLTKSSLIFLCPLVLIFLAMDGRLIFAYCGFALLLHLNIPPIPASLHWRALGSLAAFWLSAVSSGTFYTSLVILLVLTAVHFNKKGDFMSKAHAALLLLWILLLYHHDFAGALTKNIRFYGGGPEGAIGMLSHGFGSFFFSGAAGKVVIAALLIVLGLGTWFSKRLVRHVPEPVISLILLVTIAMGMFGTSMLTLALIPACTLAAVLATKAGIVRGTPNQIE